jgi:1,4-dihydroxy-2-naphthoyl-CoA synthase
MRINPNACASCSRRLLLTTDYCFSAMDTLKTITYEVTGRIARIVLNRPERGNGITLEMPAEIAAVRRTSQS